MSDGPTNHVPSAQRFFENPDHYLKQNAVIGVRRGLVRTLLGEPPPRRIIDLGCGDGSLSAQYLEKGTEIAFLDVSDTMLETARANASSARAGQASFQQLDVATADLTGLEPADVVLCVGVLAHMPAPEVVVAKAASLVKPGGRLVLQITDYGRPVGKCFYWMARLASPRRSYRLARMASDQVIRWAGSSGLNLTTTRCYPTSLPGYRRLPIRVQERMLEAMRASAWAAPLRTETLLLFDKPALPSA